MYIWVDSLSIVEDDEEDWRNEAGRVSSIYLKYSLRIAATKAKDGNGGLYSP